MKTNILILIVLFCFSCKKKTTEIIYDLPSEKDINSIIETVVLSETLLYSKKGNAFALNVREPSITFRDSSKIPLPPNPETVFFRELLKLKNEHENIFSKKDSAYILYQKDNFKKFVLNKNILSKVKYVSQLNSTENIASLYLPIFSKERNYAYVQSITILSGHFLESRGYLLEKKDSVWKVINSKILLTF